MIVKCLSDGQLAERTISIQLEKLKGENPDIEDISSEIDDVAQNIMYYIDHLENMLFPYKERIPVWEEVKRDLDIIREIL